MLISPLARKLCERRGIDPAQLRGSGPRGRIMAADVIAPTHAPRHRGETAYGDPTLPPTRPQKDGYYIFDATVNMQALAAISLPIAVQSEKLLDQRYSLFDYIVRAVVKACCSCPAWEDAGGNIDVLLFEESGEQLTAIRDAKHKTIFRIAREAPSEHVVPANYAPHIVVCDAHTTRAQVAAHLLGAPKRPGFALLVRGQSPKVGIRAGSEDLRSLDLPYTFYVSTTIPELEASRIAARLQTLLYSPVSLLLLA
ncbi:MAG TPA: E3 binding domain-containing protein [Candidatus Akkermansia intestinavium]|nr:E3 binding domain-containing protein [Candidatus Akkermansia intestinavium]